MKSIIIATILCVVFNLPAQTPSKPANPFPTNKPNAPAPSPKPNPPTPIPAPSIPTSVPNNPTSTPSAPSSIPSKPAPTPSPSIPSTNSNTPPLVKPNLPPITGNDQEQIIATVLRLFDAMKASDSSMASAIMTANCRLFTPNINAAGQTTLTEETATAFLKYVGTPKKDIIDERILKYKVDIDGPLAQVWADYNLYVNNQFIHCGVDVFQLYRSNTGWKIFELADTRRKTGCMNDPKVDITTLLDSWHADAAAANANSYFGAFTPDGVFLGTDATERWTREEFRAWAKPQFDSKKAWNFKPSKRNISLAPDQTLAWFDEELTTWMGPCRGSGVLAKTPEGWKIKQYNLTILVPNEKVQDYLKVIGK